MFPDKTKLSDCVYRTSLGILQTLSRSLFAVISRTGSGVPGPRNQMFLRSFAENYWLSRFNVTKALVFIRPKKFLSKITYTGEIWFKFYIQIFHKMGSSHAKFEGCSTDLYQTTQLYCQPLEPLKLYTYFFFLDSLNEVNHSLKLSLSTTPPHFTNSDTKPYLRHLRNCFQIFSLTSTWRRQRPTQQQWISQLTALLKRFSDFLRAFVRRSFETPARSHSFMERFKKFIHRTTQNLV